MKLHPFHVVVLLTLFLVNCGGGGNSSGGITPNNPTPPTSTQSEPDFTLVLNQQKVTLQQQGASQLQQVSATALNGFSGSISVTISGLPAGVTTLPSPPASFLSGAATSSIFQISASKTAIAGTSTITVTGTSGTISHTASFTLNVTPIAPFAIQVSPSSLTMTPATMAEVSIGATAAAGTSPQLQVNISTPPLIDTGLTVNSSSGLLTTSNPVTLRIQAATSAQPVQNLPIVITATDASNNSSLVVLPVSVSVPFPAAGAMTRSTFARTDAGPTGAVYDKLRKLLFVSVETLNEVAVLSSIDGHRVATIPIFFPGGIDETPDGSAVYVVGPYSNFITTIDPGLLQVVAQTPIPKNQSAIGILTLSSGNILVQIADENGIDSGYIWNPVAQTFSALNQFYFQFDSGIAWSADRSKLLFSQVSSTGAAVVLYDVATGQYTGPTNLDSVDFVALSPDGSQIAGLGLSGAQTDFLDDSFNLQGSVSLTLFPIQRVLYSLDGKYVYAIGTDFFAGPVVAVIDANTFSPLGIVHSFGFGISLSFSGQWTAPFLLDETNMLFGGMVAGVGYLDVSSPGFLNLALPSASLFQPSLLSLTAPTQVQLNGTGFSSNYSYKMFVGAASASPTSQTITNVSVQSTNALGLTVPAGTIAGPANVTLTRSDGFFQVLPDALTYGPTVLAIDPNSGSPAGGDLITITGYGFDSSTSISVGGKPATVQKEIGAVAGASLPTESIVLTTPAGLPGPADVIVSSPGSSTTIVGGFRYLPSVQLYPIQGALDDIVYDQVRQRLYLSNEDHNRIEVFDLASATYLSPVSVGSNPTGLALTPDGTLLAVLNSGDATVSVIDTSNLQVVHTWTALVSGDSGNGPVAFSIAPVAPHQALVDINFTGLLDTGIIHLLNLDTGSLSCSGHSWCYQGTTLTGFFVAVMASTPDGMKVFFANPTLTGGPVGILDVAADTVTRSSFSATLPDAAADADGNIFAASLLTTNAQLQRIGIMAYEPYATNVRLRTVAGEKLNSSGSLLFIPQVDGVDIFDVHTSRLVQHVALPEPIPDDFGGLAIDESSKKMFLISNSGITIAQLTDFPLSVSSVNPRTASQGAQVTLRGSGFQTGATVLIGNAQAVASYVDQSTLNVTVPVLSAGPARITVTNPNGASYSFDAALTVQ